MAGKVIDLVKSNSFLPVKEDNLRYGVVELSTTLGTSWKPSKKQASKQASKKIKRKNMRFLSILCQKNFPSFFKQLIEA